VSAAALVVILLHAPAHPHTAAAVLIFKNTKNLYLYRYTATPSGNTIQYTRGRRATTAVRRLHNNIIIVVVGGVVAVSGARTDLVPLAQSQSRRALAVRPRAPVDAILHDIILIRCILYLRVFGTSTGKRKFFFLIIITAVPAHAFIFTRLLM